MFKYYETMNMVRSTEEEYEDGFNDKIGQFNVNRRKRRNVEEQKVKAAKGWVDLYTKAHKAKKPEVVGDEDIFKKMNEIPMTFDSEKLLSVDDLPELMEDIRKDF